MTLRAGHGRGRGRPHVEVMPVDELPRGVPAPARPPPQRTPAGQFASGAGTSAAARLGGLAKARNAKLRMLLGLWRAPEDHTYAPYARMAHEWRDEHLRELASTVGGGEVGPGPASIVSSAALQLAASRWLSDQGAQYGAAKMLIEAGRLADSSRQNLLAAHELCAREAEARRKSSAAQRDASDALAVAFGASPSLDGRDSGV